MVITQGLLLAAVAWGCFGLGYYLGSARTTAVEEPVTGPCAVSGRVLYETSGGTTFPDAGAVILILPEQQRPAADEKLSFQALRPQASSGGAASDVSVELAQETQQRLRTLGGGLARVDVDGNYRISLSRGGRFYLLVLSNHGQRAADQELSRTDLAQLGRYVGFASELIGDRRYRWSSQLFKQDTELNVTLSQK
jgi:hypothetical protein